MNELRAAYVEGVLAKDCGTVVAVGDENVVPMVPDAPTIEGREARRAYCEAAAGGVQSFSTTPLEIDGYGDLAFDRGTFSQTRVLPGITEAVTISGRYMVIARKKADGSWLWQVGIYNFDAPLPQPE